MALPLMGQNFSRNVITVAPQTSSSPVGYVAFKELRSNGTDEVRLKAPDSLAGTISIVLPTALPASTECLTLSSAGAMATTSCGGGGGGGGITSLNALTASTQVFAIGTSGTAPAFSSATSTHTLNIPMASASSVTAGLLSKTDYDTFTAKQSPLTFSGIIENVSGSIGCSTCVVVSSAPPANKVPYWIGGGTRSLSNSGYDVDQSGSASSLAQRDSSGALLASGTSVFSNLYLGPASASVALTVLRGSSGQTANIQEWQSNGGAAVLSAINKDGSFVGPSVKFNGSSSGTVTVQPAATAGTWTLTLPTSAGTSGYFLQTDGSGTTTWAAASGGGGITGSGTNGQAAEWNGTTSLTSRAYASTTAGTASAILKTGTNKEVFAYDYGAQVYNVHAYGAAGDSTGTSSGTNDTTAIQAAISACENGNGGVVLFPRSGYRINASLVLGDGSSSGFSTKKPCRLVGTGPGDTASVATNGTTLFWDSATSPGATTYMVEYRGPYEGGGIEGFTFDTGSKANVLPIRLIQVQHFKGSGIHMIRTYGGPALTFSTVKDTGMNGCRSEFDRIMINAPATNGEGILFDDIIAVPYYSAGTVSTTSGSTSISGSGTSWSSAMNNKTIAINGVGYTFTYVSSTSGTISPAAISTFSGSYAINDYYGADHCQVAMRNVTAHGTTYGMHVIGADNLYIERAELESSSGVGLKFTRSSARAQFPKENTFIALSAVDGVSGSVGNDDQPNVFIDYKRGDCGGSYCDPYASITSGTKPIVHDNGMTGVMSKIQGISYYQSEVSADNTVEREYFRADQGATNLFKLSRPVSSNDVKLASYGGLQFNVPNALWHYTDSTTDANFYGDLYSSSGATDRYGIQIRRARGTKASPSNVADGDRLGLIAMWGRTNGSFNVGSIIETYADSTSSGTTMTSTLRFRTSKSGTLASPGFVVGYKYVKYELGVYADLPTCNSSNEGLRARITDATTSTWDAVVSAGSGSSRVFVICDGSNYRVDH